MPENNLITVEDSGKNNTVPEPVWDAVLDVATIQRCYEAAQEKTGWDVATLVGEAVEATVAAMRDGVR